MPLHKKEKSMADRSSTFVSTATTEREKAIDQALNQIERRFGKGAIMKLGEASRIQVEVIPTGSIALDLALGVGGIPRGRITEIYGPEASGKTTLCQHIIANAQRAGGYAAFIDAEHAMDRTYAERCGVDIANLLISQPDTGEQALEIVDALIRSNAIDVVVIDSVAALTPRAEIEGEMGDSHVGLQARLMSQAMRKLTSAISSSNTSVVFTNQLREKVGVMFGNPETTSGGKALKFYASVRLDIRRTDSIKQGQDVMGNRTRVRVVKNKVAPPFRVAEFDIMYSEGISREGGLIDLGLEMGLVKKSGAWFNVGDIRLGQGRENAKDFLRQNSDVAGALDDQIRGNLSSFKASELEIPVEEAEDEEVLEEI
jgi:recombination protein RecA